MAGPLRAAPMTSLPPAETRRWVARRKAAVVAAVQGGKITLEEACRRYNLSEEEFREWQRAFEAHGLPGLHATRLQQYRTSHSQPRRR
jgi:transposase-like protein